MKVEHIWAALFFALGFMSLGLYRCEVSERLRASPNFSSA